MKLKGSTECRRCCRWLEGMWTKATTTGERNDLQRQMAFGECFACQLTRYHAAVAYMLAADQVRILTYVATSRGEPAERWITEAERLHMSNAERALTGTGLQDFRPTWARR